VAVYHAKYFMPAILAFGREMFGKPVFIDSGADEAQQSDGGIPRQFIADARLPHAAALCKQLLHIDFRASSRSGRSEGVKFDTCMGERAVSWRGVVDAFSSPKPARSKALSASAAVTRGSFSLKRNFQ